MARKLQGRSPSLTLERLEVTTPMPRIHVSNTLSAVLFTLLSACSGGTVSGSGSLPPDPLGPSASLANADAGSPVDAGPAIGSISGRINQATGAPLVGAQIVLEPVGQIAMSADGGDYLFSAVSAGPFTLAVSAPGFQPTTYGGTLEAGESQAEPTLVLQRSVPLALTPDGGAAIDWLRYAPTTEALYVGTPGTLFLVNGDGTVSSVFGAEPGIEPLGFTPAGVPVALEACQPATMTTGSGSSIGVDARSCRLAFASWPARAAAVTFPKNQPPILTGDSVLVATSASETFMSPLMVDWSELSEAGTVSLAVDNVLASTPVANGLAGYRFTRVIRGGRLAMEPFLYGVGGFQVEGAEFWPANFIVGLSADGLTAGLEVDDPELDDTAAPLLLQGNGAAITVEGPLLENEQAGPGDFIKTLVPLSASSAVAFTEQGKAFFEAPNREAALPGAVPTQLAALPDGTPLFLANGALQSLAGSTIPFAYGWTAPTICSSTSVAIFPGVPMVYDLAASGSAPLSVVPRSAAFTRDGSRALIVTITGSLELLDVRTPAHPVELPLEGTADLALWTPDERGVVYVGTDPLGRTGLFAQGLPE